MADPTYILLLLMYLCPTSLIPISLDRELINEVEEAAATKPRKDFFRLGYSSDL